jgi:hypothetical protein
MLDTKVLPSFSGGHPSAVLLVRSKWPNVQRQTRKQEMINRTGLTVALCAVLVGALPAGAFAACSQQDAMAKGTQLSQLVQAKMAKDPTGGQAMMAKMQPIMQANQAKMTSDGTIDWDTVCTQYDALIKQAQ